MKFSPFTIVKRKRVAELKQKVELLQKQIQSAQSFIKEIERGNLSIELESAASQGAGDDDQLAVSLMSMRDQMSRIAEAEKKRNWATEGLAKFVDILRSKNDDLNALGDLIISNIVKYMNANQGSIYILNDEDQDDLYLEMIACYAYDRKKYRDQRIGLGEGLAGQAVLEKGIIYMTNLPQDYLKITSGLGEALPRNLMIVPLIMNDRVYGVIELASFYTFEAHHREFIQKLAESIASTISNVKVNQQTKKLLAETQGQAEQMRSQEEEMRQNMEELSATQEEMQRVLNEVQGKEGYINQLLNVSVDSIFTIDREYKLVTWNHSFARTLEKFGMQLQKGMNTLDWYQGEERAKQIEIYDRAFDGETFELTAGNEQNGVASYFLSIYAPLRTENGGIKEIAVFAKDVTALVVAQKKAEQLASEAQHQTEELKAQEEELRQNMEELSATQEEMHRIMKEVEAKGAYVNQLLNVSTDSIFTIDKEYKLVSWNSAFGTTLERFGFKLEKGLNTLDWYQGADRDKQIKLYDRVLRGETFEFTASNDMNGAVSHYLSYYAPLKNEAGEVYEAAVFAKDVTATLENQKKTEQAMLEISEKEAYLNAILNASKDSIFTLDKEYRLISFNDGFSVGLTQIGITLEKGFQMLELFPDEAQKKQQAAHYQRAFSGDVFDVTSKYEFNGTVSYYSTSFAPLRNSAGEVYAIVVYGKDVTELTVSKIKAEELADEANAQAEQMKAQEEVLRQNLEELTTGHEEMNRVLKAMEAKECYVNGLLNACDDMIFTVDKGYKLVSWNKTFAASLEVFGTRLEKGMDTLARYPEPKQQKEQKLVYDRVLKGETFNSTVTSEINGAKYHFLNILKPLKNENGEVYEAVIFARDITAAHNSKAENEQVIREMEASYDLLQGVINGALSDINVVGRDFKFLSFNEGFRKSMEAAGVSLKHGMDSLSLIENKKEREAVKKQIERVFKGEVLDQVQEFTANGSSKHIFIHYKPVKNKKGDIIAAAIYSEDITELMRVKKMNTELLQQVRNRN